jgi:hypothetical protein
VVDAGRTEMHRPRSYTGDPSRTARGHVLHRTKNSPSRWRFRPSSRPTFRLHVLPPDSTSTYSRSVLGASGNLSGLQRCDKREGKRKGRKLRGARSGMSRLDITPILVRCGRLDFPARTCLNRLRGRVTHYP